MKELTKKDLNRLERIIDQALLDTNYSFAIKELKKAIKNRFYNEKLNFALAEMYDHLGAKHLGKFPRIRKAATSRKKLGRRYIEKAQKIYLSIIDKNPKHSAAMYRIGNTYVTLDRLKEAEGWMKKSYSIAIKKSDKREAASTAMVLGYSLLDQDKPIEAEKWIKKGAEVVGENTFFGAGNLLKFYLKFGDKEKTLKYAKLSAKAIKKLPIEIQGSVMIQRIFEDIEEANN